MRHDRRGKNAVRMKPAWMTIGIVMIILSTVSDSVSAAPAVYVQGEILIRFRPGTSDKTIQKLHSKLGTKKKTDLPLTGVQRVKIAPDLSVQEAVILYQQDPNVLYAEPNYIRRAFAKIPNDEFFSQQWGLDNTGQPFFNGTPDADIDAPEAWQIFTDRGIDPGITITTDGTPGTPIIVAVIDSGVDYNHPDLADNIWSNGNEAIGDANSDGRPGIAGVDDDRDGLIDEDSAGRQPGDPDHTNDLKDDDDENGYVDDIRGWDFVGTQVNPPSCECPDDNPNCTVDDKGDNDPMDDYGHGTHVAGIVAARGNNGIGIAGVLWTAKIMPLKIIDKVGCGSVVDEIQAIDYAIKEGAKIINASFGAPVFSRFEYDAISAANDAGVLFVAAAGNGEPDKIGDDNDQLPIYPASYDLPNVISVAASDPDDRLASFSNFGQDTVDVAAPGFFILSTALPPPAEPCLPDLPPPSPGYCFGNGTSMAAPHVSGVAGLLLSQAQDSSLTPEEVRAVILLTADAKEGFRGLVVSSGRLNASNALRRVKGAGLIGGEGGCGFPIGMVRPGGPDSTPPVQAVVFVLTLFWPLLVLIFRKRHRWKWVGQTFRRGRLSATAVAVGIGALWVIWPQAVSAQDGLPLRSSSTGEDHLIVPFHSLGLKLGHHRYDKSEYWDTNSGFISRGDLSGLSSELEYDWRWKKSASLSVTAGHYDRETGLKNLCCTRLSFSTTYLLLTSKYYSSYQWLAPLESYFGGGVGYYFFRREIDFSGVIVSLGDDRLTASTAGIHAVIGLQWPILSPVSVFTEARYALAKVKSADLFDDTLDVGGFNVSLGLSWQFSLRGGRL